MPGDGLGLRGGRDIFAKMRQHRAQALIFETASSSQRVSKCFARHEPCNAAADKFVPGRTLAQPVVSRSPQQGPSHHSRHGFRLSERNVAVSHSAGRNFACPGHGCGGTCGYWTSLAFRLMVVPASAFDTGQPFLAASASSWNLASSIPGICASVSRSKLVMAKPASTLSK